MAKRQIWEYTNNELVEEYKKTGSKEMADAIIERFENRMCQREGENNDDVFARNFSRFVNGEMDSPVQAAKKASNDHRYLLSQKTKFCLHFLKYMAMAYNDGRVDDRNRYMCEVASKAIGHLEDNDIYSFPLN